MKISKKLLSILLCAVMVLGSVAVGGEGFAGVLDAFSVKASAESGGEEHNGIKWQLSDDGVLTISGNGRMPEDIQWSWGLKSELIKTVIIKKGLKNISYQAFRDCENLTSITIPDSVTGIGDRAFEGCSGLTSITIPDSVISIGDYAFGGCSGLTSITIPNSVTSIGDHAFYWCKKITSITIPDSVISIGDYAFYYCTSLTSITIPNSVTSIGDHAFYWCKKITSITIPDSVISIGDYAFGGCSGLTSITIPDSVISIGECAFAECTKIKEFRLDDGNKKYVIDSIGALFNKEKTELICYPVNSQRTSYTIPNSVKKICAYAFYCCKKLTSITIPNSVTSIGNYAFYSCDSLTSITIPNSVTSIGDFAFYKCEKLTSITIPNSVTSIGEYAFLSTGYDKLESNWNNGMLYNGKWLIRCNRDASGSVIIKTGTKAIADNAFDCCENLTSITIPNSVTSIGNYAFYSCDSLTSITIPNSVTSIGDFAFYKCEKLTSITIPNSVTSIGDYAFDDCEKLTSITIPNSVTSIGDYAFHGCEKLTSITISDGVTSIGSSAFSGTGYYDDPSNWENEALYIGNYLIGYNSNNIGDFEIRPGTTTIADEIFHTQCSDLFIPSSVRHIGENFSISAKSIIVDSNNKYYSSDSYGVLFNKDKTELIRFPSKSELTGYSIPKTVTQIGEQAFQGSYLLTSVIIPDSVTFIGDCAFSICLSLSYLHIPSGIKEIGYGIFWYNDFLTKIYFCSDRENVIAKVCAAENGVDFKVCNGHDEGITPAVTRKNFIDRTGSPCRCSSEFSWNAFEGAAKYEFNYGVYGKSSAFKKTIASTSFKTTQAEFDKINSVNFDSSTMEAYYYYVIPLNSFGKPMVTDASKITKTGASAYSNGTSHDIRYMVDGEAFLTESVECGKNYTITSKAPQKEDYNFLGWSKTQNAKVPDYKAGQTMNAVHSSEMSVYLYPVWKKSDYKITYNANGGVYAPAAQAKVHDEPVTLSTEKPIKNGYKFLGWAASASAKAPEYQPGGTYAENSNITLYAVWEIKDTEFYSVTYNANGGSGAPAAQTKIENVSLTLSPARPAKDGYNFIGWATSSSASTAEYYPSGNYTDNAKLTLYAVWEKEDEAFKTIDLSKYFSKGRWDGKHFNDDKYVNAVPKDSDKVAFVNSLLDVSMGNASTDCKRRLVNTIYNLMFVSQYRPTKFGGDMSNWPFKNGGAAGTSINDSGIGKVSGFRKSKGCFSYAEFCSMYVYEKSNTKRECSKLDENSIKAFVEKYADPGEHIQYDYSNTTHGIVFLGENSEQTGFYALSYGGGKNIIIFVSYKTLIEKTKIKSLCVYDANGGSFYIGTAKENTKKVDRIVYTFHCPIDVIFSYNDEVLDSRYGVYNASFGEMKISGTGDDRTITVTAYANPDYDIQILGNNSGSMTCSAKVTDTDGGTTNYTFENVPITASTAIEFAASYPDSQANLIIDENSDGADDKIWSSTVGEAENFVEDIVDIESYDGPEFDIDIASPITVDYRSIITIIASSNSIPEDYHLAIYLGSQKVAEGDNKSVSYTYGELKSDLNYTVKVIDASGNVQKDSDGNDLSKDGGKITCKAGFFQKLIAFFRGLFKSLPKIEVKP